MLEGLLQALTPRHTPYTQLTTYAIYVMRHTPYTPYNIHAGRSTASPHTPSLLARARPKEEARPPVEQLQEEEQQQQQQQKQEQEQVVVAVAVGQDRGNWRARV
jgi:hypothetical protein